MKKFFKGLLIVVLALAVIYLVLCLMGPKESRVERSIVINATPDVVMSRIVDHKYFVEKWSPWTKRDPNAKYTYEGTAGQVGHKLSWEGNKEVGKGSLTFDSISSNRVVHKFQMEEWEPSKTYMDVAPEGTGAKVTWGMHQPEIGFIWRGMMMMMNMDKMIGTDYEEGLKNLKDAVEKDAAAAPATASYTVNESDWPERVYFGATKKGVKLQDIPAFMGATFGAVEGDIKKAKLDIESRPSGLFWSFNEKEMMFDLSAGFAVKNAPKSVGKWERIVIPASKVLSVDYYGDYMKNMAAYTALETKMKEMGKDKYVAIEEYITDPGMEKDTAKWFTKIYYILK